MRVRTVGGDDVESNEVHLARGRSARDRAGWTASLVRWSMPGVVALGLFACTSFGEAPVDGGPGVEGGTVLSDGAAGNGNGTSDGGSGVDGGKPPGAVRFCKVAHPTALLCADFDDGLVSQLFVSGEEKTAGVEQLTSSTATPVEKAFLAYAASNTSAATFVVPMNLAGTGPFRLSVEVETVALPPSGRVELMQISDKGGANPMRVWIDDTHVWLGTVGSDTPIASVNRFTGPFKVVLERSGFGVSLADDEPVTIRIPSSLSDLREIKIGAGYPTVGDARIRFDDVLVELPVR